MLSTVTRLRHYAPCSCLALCLGAALLSRGANAQENDPQNPTMTAHLSNLPLSVALDLLRRGAPGNLEMVFPPELAAKVDPNQMVDVDITNGTFQDALNSVLDQVNPPLAFHLENGKYVLESSPNPRPNWGRKPAKKVKRPGGIMMRMENTPFEEAIQQFFSHSQSSYRIDPAVTAFLDPVTVSAEDMAFDEILKQLLDAVPGQKPPLTFRREKDVYLITNTNGAGRDNPVRATMRNEAIGLPSYHPTPTIKKTEVVNERLSVPLRQLFEQTDANYLLMLPNSVAAMPHVTFTMQHVPLEQAVVHLLRSAPTEPMLTLSLHPIPDDLPSAPAAKAAPLTTKPGAAKPAEANSALIYMVKPSTTLFNPTPTGDYRFAFHFHNVNLYEALKTLLLSANTNYLLQPGLREFKVSVSGDDLTQEKALDKLLAASPKPLTWKLTDGILRVSDK